MAVDCQLFYLFIIYLFSNRLVLSNRINSSNTHTELLQQM